jgi:hypothetical protein
MINKSRSSKIASAIFTSLALAIICLATYLTLSQSALAVKINIWQAKMMGDAEYFPALTIFLLAIPPLLLLMLIKIVLTRTTGKK